tara:strand:- start:137 stop:502 length:366 start_codon:yes stop_codon:yes gene_type:complete
MEPDELKEHRQWIVLQVAVMRAKFFTHSMQSDVYKEFMRSWADALQDYTKGEISKAIAQYIIESPRTTPNEGLIRQMIIKTRPRAKAAPKQPEVIRDIPNLDERRKLVQEVMQQYKVKRVP